MPTNSFYLHKRRKSGRYYIGYYLRGRLKWKSTGESTKPEALRRLSEFKTLLKKHQKALLVSELLERFFEYASANYSKKTLEIYTRTLKEFLALTGNIFLQEITPAHFDSYKSKRLKCVTPVSVNIELRALRYFLLENSRSREV